MKLALQLIIFVGFLAQPLWAVSPTSWAMPAPDWLNDHWQVGECNFATGCFERAKEMFQRIKNTPVSIPDDFSYLVIVGSQHEYGRSLEYSFAPGVRWSFHVLLSYTQEGSRYIIDPLFPNVVFPYRQWVYDITQNHLRDFAVVTTSHLGSVGGDDPQFLLEVIDSEANVLPFMHPVALMGDEVFSEASLLIESSEHQSLAPEFSVASGLSHSERTQISLGSCLCRYLACLFSVSLFHRGIALPKL